MVSFPKRKPGQEALPRGAWEPVYGTARVCCPVCGYAGLLNHEIDATGRVTPSVQCPKCDFHEHVQLIDWS